jgi:hypothetical protein
MIPDDMRELVRLCNWATICAVTPDGEPYAIEATPFFLGEDVCFMINPRGGIRRCMLHCSRVRLKFTWAAPDLSGWAGVSCFGQGGFDPDPEARLRGWAELGRVMGADYSRAANSLNKPDRSPLFRVRVQEMTGRCSSRRCWERLDAPLEPSEALTEA